MRNARGRPGWPGANCRTPLPWQMPCGSIGVPLTGMPCPRSVFPGLVDSGLWHGIPAVRSGAQRRWSVHGQLIHVGSELVFAIHHLVEGDDLSRVSGHAPHGTHQAGLGATLDLVVWLVVADRLDQVFPLEVIGRVLGLR